MTLPLSVSSVISLVFAMLQERPFRSCIYFNVPLR